MHSQEHHVKLLEQLNQSVPHNIMSLLNDARKRVEKKHAKRVANRKSASTSRARKKALVQEMSELNARLRRQALILALLPDLVIVINPEGKITFCSQQVEKVLNHRVDALVGENLSKIVAPSSREKLEKLVQNLLFTDKGSSRDEDSKQEDPKKLHKSEASKLKAKKVKVGHISAGNSADTGVNAVTDSSFPLSIVNLKPEAAVQGSSDENENSDASGSKQPSSLTNTNSSLGNSGSDDNIHQKCDNPAASGKKGSKLLKHRPSSDSSNTSSMESTECKNLTSANANL
jgi:PAS domain S-box-containing protein